MKILIACEESQAVCKEFRKLGHEAFSCDILSCSGGHPEWHIQGDVLEQLDKEWDMIIAHPPCTFLSNAGARHLFPKGILNKERYAKGLEAKEFFMKLINTSCNLICVENPTPSKIYDLPKYDQVIQPYYFGDAAQKRTCLWLKGLPNLKHPEPKTLEKPKPIYVGKNGKAIHFVDAMGGGKNRQKNRSKTFPGIARAMAEQWGDTIENNTEEGISKIDIKFKTKRNAITAK